jgi:hypothetical protein
MADEPASAAMILVQCPACGQRMRARAAMAGRQTTCPGCASPFTIEAAASATGEKPASGIRRRPPAGTAARPPSGVRRALTRPPAGDGKKTIAIGAVAAAVVLAAVLGYVTLAGGEEGGGETPEALFKKVQTAVATRDGGALYDAIAPSERRKMETQWEQMMDSAQGKLMAAMMATALKTDPEKIQSMSAREYFALGFSRSPTGGSDLAKIRDARIVSKRLQGDRCILRVRTGEKENESTVVREGGMWYLTGPGSMGTVQMKGTT